MLCNCLMEPDVVKLVMTFGIANDKLERNRATWRNGSQWTFDHTIVDVDKPLPGAKEGMQALRDKGFKIMIHSCNERDWIEKILNYFDIPYDYIWNRVDDAGKPVCFAYIDDRAVGFNGDWNDALEQVTNMEVRRSKIRGTRGWWIENGPKTEATQE